MGAAESTSRVFSDEIPHSAVPGYGPIRVSPQFFPLADHTLTLWHHYKQTLKQFGDKDFLGTRTRDASGNAGPYAWITYNQAHERAQRIATGLQSLVKLNRQDMVGVFSKNRAEWLLTEIACNRMSYVLVPLYDTLGPNVIPYILNHTAMRVVFCSGDLVVNVLNVKDKCHSLEYIVSMDEVKNDQRELARSLCVSLISMEELENVSSVTVPESPPLPSDLSTICYTSGTTGDPKGAMLTHRNLASAVRYITGYFELKSYFTHLSYLPLPHVMERINVSNAMFIGGQIGFYQGDVLFLMDDLAELKPHAFISVPRLFNRVYDKVMQGVNSAGGVKKMLFDYAYSTKRQGLQEGTHEHALWDALVFSKIRETLGGRVELIISGSAPLATNVKEFLKIGFSCRVEEGYGLTESCAAGLFTTPETPSGPHVGIPLPNIQVRLADVPDMNYTSADKPRPRGEICIRGQNIFAGYYKDPEKTAEALTQDGWLMTGDIGAWNPDGTISIIDRKKNIFKLSQGEYIAAEKIENIYIKSPFVAQIFLYGDSYQSCLVAIVVPDPEVVASWAASKKIADGDNLAKMAARDDLKAAIMKSMSDVATESKLNGYERAKEIFVHHEVFSIENDLITPTFKLKRPQLKAYFQNQINNMYDSLK